MWGRFTCQLRLTGDSTAWYLTPWLPSSSFASTSSSFLRLRRKFSWLQKDFDSQVTQKTKQNKQKETVSACWDEKDRRRLWWFVPSRQPGDSWAIIALPFRQAHWASQMPRHVPVSTAPFFRLVIWASFVIRRLVISIWIIHSRYCSFTTGQPLFFLSLSYPEHLVLEKDCYARLCYSKPFIIYKWVFRDFAVNRLENADELRHVKKKKRKISGS